MPSIDQIVSEAEAAFAAAASIADLEQAKSRFLGKAGALTELLKGLGKTWRRGAAQGGRGHQRRQVAHRDAAAVAPGCDPRRRAGPAPGRRSDRRDAARPPPVRGRPAPDLAGAGAHRAALRVDGLLGRRRPGDRERLLQLHGAAHVPGPSVAEHAGHLLHRRFGQGAAHAHLARADPLHAVARAADPHHQPRPRLPRGP